MAIYTKKGDGGLTKVFDKKTQKLIPVGKNSDIIDCIGSLDELNSFLGVIISFSKDKKLQKNLEGIQSDLFIINAILAGAPLRFSIIKTKKIEKKIDNLEKILPPQKNFIYYSGSQDASLIFFARAITRRAERSLVLLSNKKSISPSIRSFINRLSDYLFILAKSLNFENKTSEKIWKI